jgi:hypothetical protein
MNNMNGGSSAGVSSNGGFHSYSSSTSTMGGGENNTNGQSSQQQQQQQQQQSSQPRVHFGEGLNNDSHHASRNGGGRSDGDGDVDGVAGNPLQHHVMGIVTAILASVCVGGLLTILCILYVTIRPFSLSLYRRLSAQVGAASMLDALALLLPNTRIFLSGDSDVPTPVGTSLLVCNHLCNADWWAILMLGRCVGWRGSCKIFLRNEYLHVQTQNINNAYNNNNNSSSTTFSDEQAAVAAATSSTSGSSARNSPVSPVSGSAMTLTTATTTPSSNTTTSTSTKTSGSSPSAGTSPGGGGGGGGGILTTAAQRHYAGNVGGERAAGHDLSLTAKLLHLFLDFPLINGEDYVTDRENLFRLLRSFAKQDADTNHATTNHQPHHQGDHSNSLASAASSTTTWGGQPPVHLLLFPEAWSVHYKASHCCTSSNDSNSNSNSSSMDSRQAILARSNEFAQKESRPQLKHLLLPRTRGFNASLECLRASSPVVYDVTMVGIYTQSRCHTKTHVSLTNAHTRPNFPLALF